MADQLDDQDQFRGLAQDLLGRPPVFYPAGLSASLLQTPLTSPLATPTASVAVPAQKAAVSNGGNYVTAAYFKGEDHNPAGHIGISVNGGPYYGYDPTPGIGPIPLVGHELPGLLNALNFPNMIAEVPGEVDMIPVSRQPVDQVKIPVSAEQADQAKRFMLSQTGPSLYRVPRNDCVTFGAGALNAAGLQTPHSLPALFPAHFVKALHGLCDQAQQTAQKPK